MKKLLLLPLLLFTLLTNAQAVESINFFEGHNGDVSSVVFSPDGKSVLFGDSKDPILILWDVTKYLPK